MSAALRVQVYGLDLRARRNTEKKRRQIHRGEFHGQLPFDLKGMDDAVPSIDFTPMGSSEGSTYNLQRPDVDGKVSSCLWNNIMTKCDRRLHARSV